MCVVNDACRQSCFPALPTGHLYKVTKPVLHYPNAVFRSACLPVQWLHKSTVSLVSETMCLLQEEHVKLIAKRVCFMISKRSVGLSGPQNEPFAMWTCKATIHSAFQRVHLGHFYRGKGCWSVAECMRKVQGSGDGVKAPEAATDQCWNKAGLVTAWIRAHVDTICTFPCSFQQIYCDILQISVHLYPIWRHLFSFYPKCPRASQGASKQDNRKYNNIYK